MLDIFTHNQAQPHYKIIKQTMDLSIVRKKLTIRSYCAKY